LDITRLQTPDEETAQVILAEISRLHEMGKPIELIGGPGFVVRLNAARRVDSLKRPAWHFLLEVLRLMGKEEEFDEVALDYAVAFEVSPPAYRPPLPMPTRVADSHGVQAPLPENTYLLTGAIGPGNDMQIRDLKRFAEGKKQVQVDMTDLRRIDFAVVGILLELLIDLDQNGCHVTFREGNEMVNTLLQIVGVSQFASIIPKKRA
jgi:ABC-type transporter Mla MlaB component